MIISNRFDDNSDEHNFVQHQMFTIIWSTQIHTHTDNLNKFLFHPINIPSQRNVTIPLVSVFLFCVFFEIRSRDWIYHSGTSVWIWRHKTMNGRQNKLFYMDDDYEENSNKKMRELTEWSESERKKAAQRRWAWIEMIYLLIKRQLSIHKCKHARMPWGARYIVFSWHCKVIVSTLIKFVNYYYNFVFISQRNASPDSGYNRFIF